MSHSNTVTSEIKKPGKIVINKKIVFFIMLILGLAVYGNVVAAPFIFDDLSLINNNDNIVSLSKIGRYFTSNLGDATLENNFPVYRPMHTLVHAVIFNTFGSNPIPFHLLSILLHIINGYLVFLLLAKLNFSNVGSFIGGLFFLLHPVQTQAVSYISAVSDVLVATFLLTGLHSFINMFLSPSKKKWPKIISMACFVTLALLTKESAVIFFPLICLLALYYRKQIVKNTKVTILIAITTSLFLVILYLIFRFKVLSFAKIPLNPSTDVYTENMAVRISTFVSILWEYIKLIVLPIKLHIFRPYAYFSNLFTPNGLFGIFLLFTASQLAIYSFFKKTKIWFGIIWFFVCLVPFMGIVPLNAIYMEHWLYTPLIGVTILIVSFFDKLSLFKKYKVFLPICLMVFSLYGYRIVIRNIEWGNSIAFYQNEVNNNPADTRTYSLLAREYTRRGHYLLAVDTINKYMPTSGEPLWPFWPHYELALAYIGLENFSEATKELEKALHIQHDANSQNLLERIKDGRGVSIQEIHL